jgi:hypothetical protein
MRNNIIVTMPMANESGVAACVICGKTPVVLPAILVPDRDPDDGEEDLSFISYMCADHADNPEKTLKEIEDQHILWHLAEHRKESLHQ